MSHKALPKTSPNAPGRRSRQPKPTLPPRFQPDAHGSLDDRFSRSGRQVPLAEDWGMNDLYEALPAVSNPACSTTESTEELATSEPAAGDSHVEDQPGHQAHCHVSRPTAYLIDAPTGHQQVPVEMWAVAAMPPLTSEPVAVVAPRVVRTQPEPDAEVIHEEQPLDPTKAQEHHLCEQPIPHEVAAPYYQHYAPYTQYLPQPQPYQYQGCPAQGNYQPVPYGYGPPPPPAQYYPPVYPSQPAMYMPVPVPAVPVTTVPVPTPESASAQITPYDVDVAPGAVSGQVPPCEVPVSAAAFGYWNQATLQGQDHSQISADYQQGVSPVQPVQPYAAPVPAPTLEAMAPVALPQPATCFPAPATVAQVSVKAPRRKGPPQRGMFEAAKMMAKSLANQGTHPSADQSRSPPNKPVDVPAPVPFQVLDYSQTTVLAFAYELDSHMDEDVCNCYQLAMHIGVHPSVMQRWFQNRRNTTSLMKAKPKQTR